MSREGLRHLLLNRRMIALAGLGFAAGLPLMLTSRTLKLWARTEDVDLTSVGLLSLVTLPYTLKILWAPVMDRFVPPMLGRRRGWIVITQALLIAAIAGMALTGPDGPGGSLSAFAVMAVAVAFFSASQDIVADAYRTDILQPHELGAGAATYMTGYRIAMLATGAGAVYLAGYLPWRAVYLLAAGAMMVGVVSALAAPEPARQPGRPHTLAAAVFEPLREFRARNGWRAIVIVLFIVLFKLPDYMASAMSESLLVDLGFTKRQISTWALGAGLAVTIPGVLIGGPIVVRLGLFRALLIFGVAQALSNAGYLWLASAGQVQWLMMLVVAIEYFCMGLVVSGFVAFLMSQCDKRYSAAQYALLSSLMGISSALGGAPTGYLVQAVGYRWFFIVTILAAIPGMLMLRWLPMAPGVAAGGQITADAAPAPIA